MSNVYVVLMLCLACASPGSPLCVPCAASLRRAPSSRIGSIPVEAGFRHEGAAARLVHNLKYRRSLAAGRFLAAAMVAGLPADATALVPVTRSFVRRVSYGVDQAAVLCRELSHLTGLPVVEAVAAPLWWKRKAGAPRDRRKAIDFRRLVGVEDGAVLVDDVFTTGSTVASAAAVLETGIGEIRLTALVATMASRMVGELEGSETTTFRHGR